MYHSYLGSLDVFRQQDLMLLQAEYKVSTIHVKQSDMQSCRHPTCHCVQDTLPTAVSTISRDASSREDRGASNAASTRATE